MDIMFTVIGLKVVRSRPHLTHHALPQRQPVPSRTGAVHSHGAAVSEGEEEGLHGGGVRGGAELFEGRWNPGWTWLGGGI